MKEGIHPNYVESVITCSSCNSEVHTHATVPTIRVDLCSNCHPFYTGKQRIVDTAGRVDRFNQRRIAGEKAQKAVTSAARKREREAGPATPAIPAPVSAESANEAATVEVAGTHEVAPADAATSAAS